MAVIIGFSKCLLIFKNEAFDLTKIMRPHTSVTSQKNGGFQPEFAFSIWSADMDVRWLVTFITVEVKPEGSD